MKPTRVLLVSGTFVAAVLSGAGPVLGQNANFDGNRRPEPVVVTNNPLQVQVINPTAPASTVTVGNAGDIAAATVKLQAPTMTSFFTSLSVNDGISTLSPTVPTGQKYVATFVSIVMFRSKSS